MRGFDIVLILAAANPLLKTVIRQFEETGTFDAATLRISAPNILIEDEKTTNEKLKQDYALIGLVELN